MNGHPGDMDILEGISPGYATQISTGSEVKPAQQPTATISPADNSSEAGWQCKQSGQPEGIWDPTLGVRVPSCVDVGVGNGGGSGLEVSF